MTRKPPPRKQPYSPTEADRATVQNLVALGVPHAEIATCLGKDGIDPKTLRKHFRREIDTATLKVKALCMSKLIQAMNNGEAWAVCFYLKAKCGWQERAKMEITGDGGEPIKIDATISAARESLEARIAGIAARLGADAANGAAN